MERLDELFEEDELEKRTRIASEQKHKKMKFRKRRKRTILFLLFAVILAYFISDYSNIRVIDISGTNFYTKEEIMKIAKLEYGTKSILSPWFVIEKRVEEAPVVEDAKVKKSWNGIVKIQITEEKMLGYHIVDKKAYLIIDGKDDQLVEDETLLATIPYISNMDDEFLQKYKEAIKDVSASNLRLVSEISKYETSYDENMLKIQMEDGHIVYSSLDGLKNLDYYNEILKGLKTTHKCIVFAEESNAAYSQKCE